MTATLYTHRPVAVSEDEFARSWRQTFGAKSEPERPVLWDEIRAWNSDPANHPPGEPMPAEELVKVQAAIIAGLQSKVREIEALVADRAQLLEQIARGHNVVAQARVVAYDWSVPQIMALRGILADFDGGES